MRNSITLLAAASAIGFTAAVPVRRAYESCVAPLQFYTCGENGVDFTGCCSVNPCKGPAEGVSSCPDNTTPPPAPEQPQTEEQPVEPQPEQPQPEEPQPEEPQPEEPQPEQPQPEEPCNEPEQPQPEQPQPEQPQPEQPQPEQPQPEQPQPEQPQPEQPEQPEQPAECPTPTPAPQAGPDTDWLTTECKEDDSNCHWAPTYYIVKTNNETYTTWNSTNQFHVQKDAGIDGARRDSIAVFTGIPESVKKCSIGWYKPSRGINYGTYGDGSIEMFTLDLGGKRFGEVVGQDVSFAKVKDLFATQATQGVLDLGNWGRSPNAAGLDNGHEAFDCSGEVVIHFSLIAQFDGAVTADQSSKLGQLGNNFVQKAGWYLKYE